jgi:hypothetical protein
VHYGCVEQLVFNSCIEQNQGQHHLHQQQHRLQHMLLVCLLLARLHVGPRTDGRCNQQQQW